MIKIKKMQRSLETKWIEQLKEGNRKAYETIFKAYYKSVFLYKGILKLSNKYLKNTIRCISNFTTNVSKQKPTNYLQFLVFLDISNAFDTIYHTIVLNKLVRGVVLGWFRKYLCWREM